jgi:hypothetical protein
MSITSGINRSTGSVVIPVDNRSAEMKQPHTEQTLEHTETQQNTGNHKKPGTPDEHGADRFGGTRTGKENIEKTPGKPSR